MSEISGTVTGFIQHVDSAFAFQFFQFDEVMLSRLDYAPGVAGTWF